MRPTRIKRRFRVQNQMLSIPARAALTTTAAVVHAALSDSTKCQVYAVRVVVHLMLVSQTACRTPSPSLSASWT